MNKNKLFGLIGLVGGAFVGGAVLSSLIRLGATLVHPFLLNWFRIFIGFLLILIFFRGKYRLKLILDKKHLLLSLMLGIGLSLNTTMFSFGVSRTTLIASQLIYVFTPIAASLMAFFLLKEKITFKKMLGMSIAFLGVLLLIIFSKSPEEKLSLGTFYGNSLIFIGMLGYSTYMVFSKKLSNIFTIVEMVVLTGLFSSILLFPFAVYAIYQQGWSQINFHSMFVMLLIALSATAFMLLNQTAIKHLSTSSASMGSILSPEFAALAGIVIYNEKLSLILLISMVLSIGGTMLSVTAEKVTFLDKIKSVINKLKII
jgi:drug/metabolite transporter (DMT)-like permease